MAKGGEGERLRHACAYTCACDMFIAAAHGVAPTFGPENRHFYRLYGPVEYSTCRWAELASSCYRAATRSHQAPARPCQALHGRATTVHALRA